MHFLLLKAEMHASSTSPALKSGMTHVSPGSRTMSAKMTPIPLLAIPAPRPMHGRGRCACPAASGWGALPSLIQHRPNEKRPCCSRSEEHTSELQSHLNLVCRLLLEKKKN